VDSLTDDYAVAVIDDQTYDRVPYIYCSHNRANLGDNCLTRDFGADAYERMKNILDDLNSWYILRSFPRGKVGVDNYNYVSRYYNRIYDRLKGWNDLYGLYSDFLPLYYDENELQEFLTDPEGGWGAKTWSVQNAFNYLVQTVLMPDIGAYGGPYTMPDGNPLMVRVGGNGDLNLDVSDGRYYATSWRGGDRECGYMWWECLHHVGFYLDKIMAIEALTDTSTNFVARSTPEDIREWEVGYYSTFTDQLLQINTAIMNQDWSRVGPYNDNGRLAFPNYAGSLNQRHDSPVDPYATFTVQLFWQVLGQARFPNNFNRSFVEESRIFVMGTGTQPDLPGDRVRTYLNPITGITYGAVQYGGKGAGESMLDRALFMTSISNYCDDSNATSTAADDCQQIDPQSRDYVTWNLVDYLELIQAVSDVSHTMDFGNPYTL
jgi:hypothetical protein